VLGRASSGLYWLGGGVLRRARGAARRNHRDDGPAPAKACVSPVWIPAACSSARRSRSARSCSCLEVLLSAGVTVLYGTHLHAPLVLIATALLATAGLAAAGTAYAAVASGLRVGTTLLPLLLLPVFSAGPARGHGAPGKPDWRGAPGDAVSWLELLAAFAVLYVAVGVVGYGTLQEES